jgi:2,3-bisphosphoglycerate-dependent phosphoglycerate mutase
LTAFLSLIRHGETESNRQGLALGRADVSLNETGRLQAERLAAALSSTPIVAVYSSPLSRTMDTSGPIAAAHGLAVQIEPGLIEMDIGELDGLSFSEVRERYPGLLEEWVSAEGPARVLPAGERLLDVQQRAVATVHSLAERHPGESVCAVTHNFVILSLLADILGVDLTEFRRLRHAVAGVTTLELNGDRRRLLRFNDTCHLASPG